MGNATTPNPSTQNLASRDAENASGLGISQRRNSKPQRGAPLARTSERKATAMSRHAGLRLRASAWLLALPAALGCANSNADNYNPFFPGGTGADCILPPTFACGDYGATNYDATTGPRTRRPAHRAPHSSRTACHPRSPVAAPATTRARSHMAATQALCSIIPWQPACCC